MGLDLTGMNKNEAITALINSGLDFTEANKYWIANKPANGSGFKARLFDRLAEGEMSEGDLDLFLLEESANVKKNRANWVGIVGMANRIWEAK